MNTFQINHAASLLFWLRANDITIVKALEQFSIEGAKSFADVPFFKQILLNCGIDGANAEQAKKAIIDEIDEHLSTERQLTGPLYLDEITSGRSLEAAELDVSYVCAKAIQVDVAGEITTIGKLFLRHPLPAVAFADRPVNNELIRLASTQAALGMEYPVFLMVQDCIQIDRDTYALTGVFKIPVADTEHGNEWSCCIQNSSRFTHYLQILNEANQGAATIKVIPQKG